MPNEVTLPNVHTYDPQQTWAGMLHGSALHVDDRQEIRRLKSGLLVASNPIINGGFQSWQRGGTFTAPVFGTKTADCWTYYKLGTMVHDVLRSTDVPPFADLVPFQTYALLVDCTTAQASIGAGDITVMRLGLEGYNWAPYAQHALTLTFWHKHTKTGIYSVALRNTGFDRACVLEYTQDASDVWEFASIQIPASPSAGTWDYTTGVGVYMSWALAVGTTNTTTPGSWQTGNFLASTNQVNACDSTANNFRLWGTQLARGSEGLPYAPRSFGLEQYLCKRYVQAWANDYISAAKNGTTLKAEVVRFPVEFRVAPTAAAGATYAVNTGAAGTPAFSQIGERSCRATNSGTAWTAGALVQLTAVFSAEI